MLCGGTGVVTKNKIDLFVLSFSQDCEMKKAIFRIAFMLFMFEKQHKRACI